MRAVFNRGRSVNGGVAESLERRRLLSAGDLDTGFGAGGVERFDFAPTFNDVTAMDLAIQTDGKFVLAGSTDPKRDGKTNFFITRYNADGTLDESFGDFGAVSIDFGGADMAEGVKILGGKIIVAGTASQGTRRIAAVARLNGDGSLDTSFSSEGVHTFAFSDRDLRVHDVAVQDDGRIVLAGEAGSEAYIARFTASGARDRTFATRGYVLLDRGDASAAWSVAIDAAGRIDLAGALDADFLLARFTRRGELDARFSEDGIASCDFEGGVDRAHDLAFAPDGSIVAAGAATTSGAHTGFGIARFTPSGKIDKSFSNTGRRIAFSEHNKAAYGVIVDPNTGNIFTLGYGTKGESPTNLLGRFLPDGTLDSVESNGYAGKVQAIQLQANGAPAYVGFTTGQDPELSLIIKDPFSEKAIDSNYARRRVTDVEIQNDGKAILSVSGSRRFNLLRLNTDGSVDSSFGQGGQVATNFQQGPLPDYAQFPDSAEAQQVQVLAGGKILAFGTLEGEPHDYPKGFALARYMQDGTLDQTFGVGGIAKGEEDDESHANNMIIGPGGKIYAAGLWNENGGWAARFNADGTIDNTFGTVDSRAFDYTLLAVGPGGKALYKGYRNDTRPTIYVRYNSDGTRDSTFGFNGTVHEEGYGYSDPNPVPPQFVDVELLANDKTVGVYPPGYLDQTTVTQNFLLARLDANGNIDTTFGTNGYVSTDLGENETAFQILVQSDGKLLVAGTQTDSTTAQTRIVLARYNANGSLDSSFGDAGSMIAAAMDQPIESMKLSLASDGKAQIIARAPREVFYDARVSFVVARVLLS